MKANDPGVDAAVEAQVDRVAATLAVSKDAARSHFRKFVEGLRNLRAQQLKSGGGEDVNKASDPLLELLDRILEILDESEDDESGDEGDKVAKLEDRLLTLKDHVDRLTLALSRKG
jgi:hypothetical protein